MTHKLRAKVPTKIQAMTSKTLKAKTSQNPQDMVEREQGTLTLQGVLPSSETRNYQGRFGTVAYYNTHTCVDDIEQTPVHNDLLSGRHSEI